MIQGVAASPGVALGPAYVLRPADISVGETRIDPSQVENEIGRLEAAIAEAAAQLEALRKAAGEKEAGEILGAQILMLDDPGLTGAIESAVRDEKFSVEWAVQKATEQYAAMLDGLEDEYIRERAADVRDIGRRLIRVLKGLGASGPSLDKPSIVVAQDLTPSETASLDESMVLGIAIDRGSTTCHTAILARAKGIPAVVGAAPVSSGAPTGTTIAIDGTSGTVEIDPSPEAIDRYMAAIEGEKREKARLAATKFLPARTLDDVGIEVSANIGFPGDVPVALGNGAEGVGLFRTEFLFMNRNSPPSEEEQYESYAEALSGMGGRPVVIRTLDIGGDKDIPYLNLPAEMNPFLGWRALRMCLDRPEILRTQLRAIYRASVHGKAKIMFPMVATIEEVRAARDMVAEVTREFDRLGTPYGSGVEVGIMVEIPSAAVMARSLGGAVDFFSIGTNDLTQYTMAVDRTNERVARLYDALHPSVLRLIALVAEGAGANGIWAGMCGELAGDPLATGLLVGLGLTELSVSMPLIPRVKENVRSLTMKTAREIADRVMAMDTAGEIREYLSSTSCARGGK